MVTGISSTTRTKCGPGLLGQGRERVLEVRDRELLTLAQRDRSDDEGFGRRPGPATPKQTAMSTAAIDHSASRTGVGANGPSLVRISVVIESRSQKSPSESSPEEVAGRDPRVVGLEDPSQGRLGRRVHVRVDLGDQDADLVRIALAREPVVGGLELALHPGRSRRSARARSPAAGGPSRRSSVPRRSRGRPRPGSRRRTRRSGRARSARRRASRDPCGMPEPMNRRTGWWRSFGLGGASTRSRSIVHV